MALGVTLLVGTVLAVLWMGPGGLGASAPEPPPRPAARAIPQDPTPADPTLAWAVAVGERRFVTVFSAPRGGTAVAVVIPDDTVVDVPGGPATVGEAHESTGLLTAAAQAALERRVGHAATSDQAELQVLVDSLGGLTVDLVEPVPVGLEVVGPGQVHMGGEQVVQYLSQAGYEGVLRWEEILSALLSAAPDEAGWSVVAAGSPNPSGVNRVLVASAGAQVHELPTTVTEIGRTTDPEGVLELVTRSFPGGGGMTRVVVLNGVGVPGLGGEVVARIAPGGFWVLATQNAPAFDVEETQVIAASEDFREKADALRSILGVGRVYVGGQPTGVADVTIVVGRDFVGG